MNFVLVLANIFIVLYHKSDYNTIINLKFIIKEGLKMKENRYIGQYPVIGIRPTIDGRRGVLGILESLENQAINMARSFAKLYADN